MAHNSSVSQTREEHSAPVATVQLSPQPTIHLSIQDLHVEKPISTEQIDGQLKRKMGLRDWSRLLLEYKLSPDNVTIDGDPAPIGDSQYINLPAESGGRNTAVVVKGTELKGLFFKLPASSASSASGNITYLCLTPQGQANIGDLCTQCLPRLRPSSITLNELLVKVDAQNITTWDIRRALLGTDGPYGLYKHDAIIVSGLEAKREPKEALHFKYHGEAYQSLPVSGGKSLDVSSLASSAGVHATSVRLNKEKVVTRIRPKLSCPPFGWPCSLRRVMSIQHIPRDPASGVDMESGLGTQSTPIELTGDPADGSLNHFCGLKRNSLLVVLPVVSTFIGILATTLGALSNVYPGKWFQVATAVLAGIVSALTALISVLKGEVPAAPFEATKELMDTWLKQAMQLKPVRREIKGLLDAPPPLESAENEPIEKKKARRADSVDAATTNIAKPVSEFLRARQSSFMARAPRSKPGLL